MAARGLDRRGAHALSQEALTVRLYRAVILGDDVPGWLRLPSGSFNFRIEQVWSWHTLGRPNQLLFVLGQVACESERETAEGRRGWYVPYSELVQEIEKRWPV